MPWQCIECDLPSLVRLTSPVSHWVRRTEAICCKVHFTDGRHVPWLPMWARVALVAARARRRLKVQMEAIEQSLKSEALCLEFLNLVASVRSPV